MSSQAWFIVGVAGFSLFSAALIALAVIFVREDIPAVIGDLTGRTAARQIEYMQSQTSIMGAIDSKSGAFGLKRGTTVSTRDSGGSKKATTDPLLVSFLSRPEKKHSPAREDLKKDEGVMTTLLEDESAMTTFLEENATTALEENVTTVLEENVTTVLEEGSGDSTTILKSESRSGGIGARMEIKCVKSVVIVHTDEMID
ncbi:MAG: hypothetical protein LBL35_09065 [Clostridiales bacterium]|jgi:hypothetical protein|nr:hypothetical protein [Clostridiales bacterium]